MFVSPSQLDRIYQRGSLRNIDGGFEFKLKNVIDSGTLSGVKLLTVDGTEVPLAKVSLKTNAGEKQAEEISYRSPMPLYYNVEAVVRVAEYTLEPGVHDLVLTISVYEAGTLQLKVNDEIVP